MKANKVLLSLVALGYLSGYHVYQGLNNSNQQISSFIDKVKAGEEVDYSLPIRNNANKKYSSNIPDEFYSEADNYGLNNDSNSIPEVNYGIDLISYDGNTNYANSRAITINENDTLTFYFEAGYSNYNDDLPYNWITFNTTKMDQAISVTCSQVINNVTYSLFDSANSNGSHAVMDRYSEVETITDYAFPYTYDAENEKMVMLNDYHLPYITLTGKAIGTTVLTLGLENGIITTSLDIVVNVVSSSDAVDLNRASVYKGNTNSNIADISLLTKGVNDNYIYLSKDYSSSYTFKPTIANSNSSFYYDIKALNSLRSSIRSGSNGKTITFYDTGLYQFQFNLNASVQVYNGTSGNETDNYHVDGSYLSKTVYVYIYDSDNLPGLNINDADINSLTYYNNTSLTFSIDEFSNSEQFTISYLVDDVPVDSNFLYSLPAGDHKVTASIVNSYFPDETLTISENFTIYASANYIYGEFAIDEMLEVVKGKTITIHVPDQYTSEGFDNFAFSVEDTSILKINAVTPTSVQLLALKEGSTTLKGTYLSDDTVLVLTSTINVLQEPEVPAEYIQVNFNEGTSVSLLLDDKETKTLTLPSSMTDKEISFTWFVADSDICSLVVDASTYIAYVTPLGAGETTIFAYGMDLNTGVNYLAKMKLNIKSKTTQETPAILETIHFNEGEKNTLLLSSKPTSLITIPESLTKLGLKFSWVSLNASIVSLESSADSYSALLTSNSKGQTEIIATATDSNNKTYLAQMSVVVLESEPNLSIDVVASNSNGTASLNIYDTLKISLNKNGFEFSSAVSYQWYLDDALIHEAYLNANDDKLTSLSNKTTSFYLKRLPAGLHTLSLLTSDMEYSLNNIKTVKEINISSVTNQERTISFNKDSLFLIKGGENYNIKALLDGVEDTSYTYNWSIKDTSVASSYMASGNALLIQPNGAGDTILTVYCDIGTYEPHIISAEIALHIEELESLTLSPENEYPKPGEDVVMNVLVNGKKNCLNLNPSIVVKSGDTNAEFTYQDGQIIVPAALSGNLYYALRVNDMENNYTLLVSSFNFKQFVLASLPYLALALVLSLGVYFFFKSKNPFKAALRKSKNMLTSFDDAIKSSQNVNNTPSKTRASYRYLLQKVRILDHQITYNHDDGIDDFKKPLDLIHELETILVSLIQSKNEHSFKNVKTILVSLKNNKVKTIDDIINEIVISNEKYQQSIIQSNTVSTQKKKVMKKKNMTEEEYDAYLRKAGIGYDAEDIDITPENPND